MKNILIIFTVLFITPNISYAQIEMSGQKATYSNPNPQPIQVEIKRTPSDIWNQQIQSNNLAISNSIMALAASGAFRTARQKAKDIIPLNGINLNVFKYLVYSDITASKQKETSKIKKTLDEELGNTNFVLVKNITDLPEDLSNNPRLGLYLYLNSEDKNWPFKEVVLSLTTFNGELIHQRAVNHDRSAHFLTRLVLESIKTYPQRFDEELLVQQSQKEASLIEKKQKEEAIKKLKEAKELLELEVITQDEYDSLKSELSPIIKGNN